MKYIIKGSDVRCTLIKINSKYGVMIILLLKRGNMSKHDIMLIILKYSVSKIYLIVILYNLKLT